MLEKEVFDLTLIGENSSVKFPKVLFSRAADDIIPLDCYAMELVQGKSAFVNPKGWFLSKKKELNLQMKLQLLCTIFTTKQMTNLETP